MELLKKLAAMRQYGGGGFSFDELPRRLVLGTLIIYFFTQWLLAPIYLNTVREYEMRGLVEKAVLMAPLFDSGIVLDTQKAQELHQAHNLEGIIIEPMAPDYETKMILFRYGAIEKPFAHTYELDTEKWIPRLKDTLMLMLADKNSFAVIKGKNEASGMPVCAIFRQGYLSFIMLEYFLVINGFCLLMAMILAIFFKFYFGREVVHSVDEMMTNLYGKDMVKISGNRQMQKSIKSHIAEQTRLASLGAGTSKLAHDLRNVMSSILLYAEKMVESDNPNEKKMGNRLMLSVEQVVGLCEWATQYSSNVKKSINRHKQPLKPLVDEVLTLVRLHDVGQQVKLKNEVSPKIIIDCERKLIFRVLFNVVLNAIQAIQSSDKKGQVVVKAEQLSAGCEILIQDNGPGISPDIVEKLFLPYKGSFKPGGSGLGMAIAEELVKWHGGEISLEYTGYEGSGFIIKLPHQTDRQPDDYDADDAGDADNLAALPDKQKVA